MMKKIVAILAFSSGLSFNVSGQTVSETLDSLVSPKNDSLFYYRVGGGRTFTAAPRWNVTNIQFGITARATGLACGGFDPAVTVENTLNRVKNLDDEIMQQLENAASAAISALPGYILQKIDPGLYDFFMNNILRAERNFGLATKTCETMQQQIANGEDPYEEMVQVSWGDTWKASAGTGGVDVTDASQQASNPSQHNDGVEWFGERRAGSNQNPIWVLQDTATAGFNKLLGRSNLLDLDDVANPEEQPLTQIFEGPEDLREWIVTVLGDTQIGICENCEKGTVGGQGLTILADEKKEIIYPLLVSLYTGDSAPTQQNLRAVSAPGVALTAQVIRTLQELDQYDAQVFLQKMLDEIVLARVVNEAILVHQTLRTGVKDPDIVAYRAAYNEVLKGMSELNKDTDVLLREARIKKELLSSTVTEALLMGAAERNVGMTIRENDHEDSRPVTNGAIEE